MSAQPQLLPQHIEAFQLAARLYNVAILVRRTNAASLRWMSRNDTAPKYIDCKAKTADFGFNAHGRFHDVAGLVVDPAIAGAGSFRPGKLGDVAKSWEIFAREQLWPKHAPKAAKWLTYRGKSYHYFVQDDPQRPFFGCVMYTKSTLRTAAKAIHGDIDLYAIVDMANPSENVRMEGKLQGEAHNFSPKFRDVQAVLNGPFGFDMPLVVHGAEEVYRTHHTDQILDAFFPCGEIVELQNRYDIETLYRERFKGRRLFHEKGAGVSHRGKFMRMSKGAQVNPTVILPVQERAKPLGADAMPATPAKRFWKGALERMTS